MGEDEKLYKSFLDGNKESFNKLVIKYRIPLERFILKYVNNIEVAEDIFQDTFLYLLVNQNNYNFKYRFKTYLYIIAKSRSLNYLKQNKIEENIDDYEEVLRNFDTLEDRIVFDENRKERLKIVNEMPKNQQMVMLLLEEEFSNKEIAKIMNKSLTEVKMIIYRARKKLRKELGKEVSDYEN